MAGKETFAASNPEDGHPQPIVDRIREEYGWTESAGYPAGLDVADLYADPGKAILTAPERRKEKKR